MMYMLMEGARLERQFKQELAKTNYLNIHKKRDKKGKR